MAVQPEIEIPKHYVPTFERNVLHALQQKASRLEAFVTPGMGEGEGASPVDLYEDTEAVESTDRYGDTPIMEVGRARRWVTPRKYDWGTLVDNIDKLKLVLDPTSNLVMAARMAMGRALDRKVIMPAFFGAALQGKDLTDATNGTAVVFDTTKYRVANTVGSAGGATAVGLNVDKIIKVKQLFIQNEVDLDAEKLNIAITDQQWADLFADIKAVNGDYINGRPIAEGDLGMIMNVNFIKVQQLPSTGASPNDRLLPVWVKSGIQLRKWKEVTTSMALDPTKKFRPRVYMEMAAGAVRSQLTAGAGLTVRASLRFF
jgi:hypothetical protein